MEFQFSLQDVNNTLTTGSAEGVIDNLYPALLECFVIILAGYTTGRCHLISESQSHGLGVFITKFALPALLFNNMCTLDFSVVNWLFLASIGIAKTVIFVLVGIFTFLLVRPRNWGKVGLFSIFSTQSNDFSLGLPIVQALYSKSHPDFANYIFLVAPISLVFLNPIGFVLLEVHKQRKSSQNTGRSRWMTMLFVFKGVVLNPIVFMTALGIAGNFVFKQKVPSIISEILKVLGNAFTATALFYLGLNMVGKVQKQTGRALIIPILLICAKMLLMPFLVRQMVTSLNAGGNLNDTADLSIYGFIYGTLPTAPTVFLYAKQYSLQANMVASGMVASTFLFAPLMFVTAKMVALPVESESDYKSLVIDTGFDVGIVGLICCVLAMIVFILSKRWRSIPHQFTMGLLVTQMLGCLGMILWKCIDHGVAWQRYTQFVLFFIGMLGSRCWIPMLAAALCGLRCKSLCFVIKIAPWLHLYAFGLPVGLCCVLIVLAYNTHDKAPDPAFAFGVYQEVIAAVVLIVNILITIVLLVIQVRYDRKVKTRRDRMNSEGSEVSDGEESEQCRDIQNCPKRTIETQTGASLSITGADMPGSSDQTPLVESVRENVRGKAKKKPKRFTRKKKTENVQCENCNGCNSQNIEDILPFPSSFNGAVPSAPVTTGDGDSTDSECDVTPRPPPCSQLASPLMDPSEYCGNTNCGPQERELCREIVASYDNVNYLGSIEAEEAEMIAYLRERDHFQITRHIVLILSLLLSAGIGSFLCIWRLLDEHRTGLYIELEFLDSVFMYGQGMVVFVIFALDTRIVIEPFLKRLRKLWYKVEVIRTEKLEDMVEEDRVICERFIKHHLEACKQSIVNNRRFNLTTYEDVFLGSDFVDWLIERGLAKDRPDAIKYGSLLVTAQVIEHVQREHQFHDLPFFYQFVVENEGISILHTD